jgi:hypothetical protein
MVGEWLDDGELPWNEVLTSDPSPACGSVEIFEGGEGAPEDDGALNVGDRGRGRGRGRRGHV